MIKNESTKVILRDVIVFDYYTHCERSNPLNLI